MEEVIRSEKLNAFIDRRIENGRAIAEDVRDTEGSGSPAMLRLNTLYFDVKPAKIKGVNVSGKCLRLLTKWPQ